MDSGRRHWMRKCGMGMGGLAFADLFSATTHARNTSGALAQHFPGKARIRLYSQKQARIVFQLGKALGVKQKPKIHRPGKRRSIVVQGTSFPEGSWSAFTLCSSKWLLVLIQRLCFSCDN